VGFFSYREGAVILSYTLGMLRRPGVWHISVTGGEGDDFWYNLVGVSVAAAPGPRFVAGGRQSQFIRAGDLWDVRIGLGSFIESAVRLAIINGSKKGSLSETACFCTPLVIALISLLLFQFRSHVCRTIRFSVMSCSVTTRVCRATTATTPSRIAVDFLHRTHRAITFVAALDVDTCSATKR